MRVKLFKVISMKARYKSHCPRCNASIRIGEDITKINSMWVHTICINNPYSALEKFLGVDRPLKHLFEFEYANELWKYTFKNTLIEGSIVLDNQGCPYHMNVAQSKESAYKQLFGHLGDYQEYIMEYLFS